MVSLTDCCTSTAYLKSWPRQLNSWVCNITFVLSAYRLKAQCYQNILFNSFLAQWGSMQSNNK